MPALTYGLISEILPRNVRSGTASKRELRQLADRQLCELALGHVDAQDQRVEVLDDEQRAVGAFDDAADRRHGVADLDDVEPLGDGAARSASGCRSRRAAGARAPSSPSRLRARTSGCRCESALIRPFFCSSRLRVVVALELAHGRLVERDFEPQLVAVEARERLARAHALALVREHLRGSRPGPWASRKPCARIRPAPCRCRAPPFRHAGWRRPRPERRGPLPCRPCLLSPLALPQATSTKAAAASRSGEQQPVGRAVTAVSFGLRCASRADSRRSGGGMLRSLSVVVKYNTR